MARQILRSAVLAAALFLLLPGAFPHAASAQVGPVMVARQRASQFFLLELAPGLTLSDRGSTLGYDVGLTFGVGGKLRFFPPRFFLLASFGFGGAGSRGDRYGAPYAFVSNHYDLAGGLRILIPIVGPLRVYADVLGGVTRVAGSLERAGAMPLTSDSWEPMLMLAAGLAVRVHTNFSVGLRARFDLMRGEDALAAAAGLPTKMQRFLLELTATMHF